MTYQGSSAHNGPEGEGAGRTASDLGERALLAATRLFAALGYDGTSAREIADAVGVDVATLTEVAGAKRDLYLAVLDRALRRHVAMLEKSVQEFHATGCVHRLLARYLDFCLESPDNLALWMHRWLSDAADVTDFERRYIQPIMVMVGGPLREWLDRNDIGVEVDVEFSVWTVMWCAHGFLTGGMVGAEGEPRRASDVETLRRFRRHMHRLWHRQLCLPGEPPAEFLL
ncbi:TetR/AcrR family transcriptional regulator [Microtetraspora niveoalba]|uniref:TetR/AcrR family transcriptional regulator n=1 Tax=Microtetraspora niveoalba TaxID=46175 RepID=UPI00082C81EF|nr:TetR/AcrR family transcriptional regulator [Microtetraspora niveoalba]